MVGEEGTLSAFIDSHYLNKGEGVSSGNAGNCSKARNAIIEFIAVRSAGFILGHSSGKERSGYINTCIFVYS